MIEAIRSPNPTIGVAGLAAGGIALAILGMQLFSGAFAPETAALAPVEEPHAKFLMMATHALNGIPLPTAPEPAAATTPVLAIVGAGVAAFAMVAGLVSLTRRRDA